MVIVCEFCGKSFTCIDGRAKKYCPECRYSGKRYAKQFKERRKKDPVADIYAKHYSKRHNMLKANKYPKKAFDNWRQQAKIKKHEISIGEITVEDFANWCDETLNPANIAVLEETRLGMKPLPINFIAKEDNRLGEITLGGKGCYSLYQGECDESSIYFLTDALDPKKIYMMVDRELWNIIFE